MPFKDALFNTGQLNLLCVYQYDIVVVDDGQAVPGDSLISQVNLVLEVIINHITQGLLGLREMYSIEKNKSLCLAIVLFPNDY